VPRTACSGFLLGLLVVGTLVLTSCFSAANGLFRISTSVDTDHDSIREQDGSFQCRERLVQDFYDVDIKGRNLPTYVSVPRTACSGFLLYVVCVRTPGTGQKSFSAANGLFRISTLPRFPGPRPVRRCFSAANGLFRISTRLRRSDRLAGHQRTPKVSVPRTACSGFLPIAAPRSSTRARALSRFSAANGLFRISTNGQIAPGGKRPLGFSAANGLFRISTTTQGQCEEVFPIAFQCRERLVQDFYQLRVLPRGELSRLVSVPRTACSGFLRRPVRRTALQVPE